MTHLDINTGQIVANAAASERTSFIRRTYLHVAGAFVIFALLEAALIKAGIGEQMMSVLATSKYSWLIVLGAFMFVSYLANNWAHSSLSREKQYLGLGIFIVAEAIIFLPLIYMAAVYAPDILRQAAIATIALTVGITFTAFTTKKDFSFLGPILGIGGMIALGLIVASIIFGFTLGLVFSGAMVIFAAGAILYSTSNVMHSYHTEQHVAAALSLFASIALMFWYILQFLMSLSGEE